MCCTPIELSHMFFVKLVKQSCLQVYAACDCLLMIVVCDGCSLVE